MFDEEDIDTPVDVAELGGVFEGPTDKAEAQSSAPEAEKPEAEPQKEEEPEAQKTESTREKTSQDEEKSDASEESGKADDDLGQQREQHIPRARFDEVNIKYRAEQELRAKLEAELNALRGRETEAQLQIDIEAKEKSYAEAVMLGDDATARRIREEINHAHRQAAIAEISNVYTTASQPERIETEIARSVAEYPHLFIGDAAEDLREWSSMYEGKGFTQVDAFNMAVQKVLKFHPAPQAVQSPGPAPEMKTDLRKQEALKQAAKVANAQPPSPSDAGIGNRTVSEPPIETQEDWEKLSEKERRRMLGG